MEVQLILDYAGYIDKMEGDSFMDPNDGFIKVLPNLAPLDYSFPRHLLGLWIHADD